ncbi:HNH endonuclease signature motif containing protein [Streptomyces sp. NPDC051664]|uniref:HNH endonuclease signature motif containing protein n=1 Tax=Streptomyces sp. NPDC051664 TaxID=3365668 RepID=UPI003790338A
MLRIEDLPAPLSATATEAGCWEWRGERNKQGYGYYRVSGKRHYAHRASYEAVVGPIPDGLEIDHLCVNPPCINPAHLEPVTHAENQRRAAERQTACRRAGHDWTDLKNVRVRSNGSRYCAECHREAQRRRRAQETGVPFKGATRDRMHCPQGHAYDEENTLIRSCGRRACRACKRQRDSDRRAQKKT